MILQAANTRNAERSAQSVLSTSGVKNGNPFAIGAGFSALSFREKDFAGIMDPLVMVDHYRMTAPTFGAHPHAGLCALSILFEDSQGRFHNRDSLGNDFDLLPGDVYWLNSGSGALHDEAPRPGSAIHGLQVFVNLPQSRRNQQPESFLLRAEDIPVMEDDNARVRLLQGRYQTIQNPISPVFPMTILEGQVNPFRTINIDIESGQNGWLYLVSGELQLQTGQQSNTLQQGQALAVKHGGTATEASIQLQNNAEEQAHFVFFAASPINESFIQKGPIIMQTHEQILRKEQEYAAGKFGSIG